MLGERDRRGMGILLAYDADAASGDARGRPAPCFVNWQTVQAPDILLGYLRFPSRQLIITAASTMQVALIIMLALTIERLVGLARIDRG